MFDLLTFQIGCLVLKFQTCVLCSKHFHLRFPLRAASRTTLCALGSCFTAVYSNTSPNSLEVFSFNPQSTREFVCRLVKVSFAVI